MKVKRLSKEELDKLIEEEVQKRLAQTQINEQEMVNYDDPSEMTQVRNLTVALSMERAVNTQMKDALLGLLKSSPSFADALKEVLRYGVVGFRSILEYDKHLRKREFDFMRILIILGIIILGFAFLSNQEYARSVTEWFSSPINEGIFLVVVVILILGYFYIMRRRSVKK